MSAPTEQEHFDAIKALLTAADAEPLDYDDPVDSELTAYTLLSVSDRFTGSGRRQTGRTGIRSVRISVRAVGDSTDNVREMRKRTAAALDEVRVTVAGRHSTAITFETAEPVAPDGDADDTGRAWFSARTTYTYSV